MYNNEINKPGLSKEALGIIRLFIRNKRLLAIIIIITITLSAFFTAPFIIPPKYRAEVIIYPPSSNTNAGLINSDIRFGDDKEINEAIQLLSSAIVRDSIIDKYRLAKHYNIDTTTPSGKHRLLASYDDNFLITNTKYNSISISVLDEDPGLAKAMANAIVQITDNVKTAIIRKNLLSASESLTSQMNMKMDEIRRLADSVNNVINSNYDKAIGLRRNHYQEKRSVVNNIRGAIDDLKNQQNVYDINDQYKIIYKENLAAMTRFNRDSAALQYMQGYFKPSDTAYISKKADMEGARVFINKLTEKLHNLNMSGKTMNSLNDNYNFEKTIMNGLESDYEYTISTFEKEYPNLSLETLKSRYTTELSVLNDLKTKFEAVHNNLLNPLPASYVISPAELPDKKYSPNRLLIVSISAFVAFLVSLLSIIAIDKVREIKGLLNEKNTTGE